MKAWAGKLDLQCFPNFSVHELRSALEGYIAYWQIVSNNTFFQMQVCFCLYIISLHSSQWDVLYPHCLSPLKFDQIVNHLDVTAILLNTNGSISFYQPQGCTDSCTTGPISSHPTIKRYQATTCTLNILFLLPRTNIDPFDLIATYPKIKKNFYSILNFA